MWKVYLSCFTIFERKFPQIFDTAGIPFTPCQTTRLKTACSFWLMWLFLQTLLHHLYLQISLEKWIKLKDTHLRTSNVWKKSREHLEHPKNIYCNWKQFRHSYRKKHTLSLLVNLNFQMVTTCLLWKLDFFPIKYPWRELFIVELYGAGGAS